MSELYKCLASVEDVSYRQKLLKIYAKELDELTARKMKLILEQQFTLGNLGKMHESMKGIIKKQGVAIKEQLAKEHNNGWLFITVNPQPKVCFKLFYKLIKKLSERKMFDESHYAFEQRGVNNDEAGKGFHVHMLCKRNLNYKPTHVKRNIKSGCKKLVLSTENNALLNIQVIGDDFAADKYQYFTGIKKGTGKDVKQTVDKYWRQKCGLSDVYEHKKENHDTKLVLCHGSQ